MTTFVRAAFFQGEVAKKLLVGQPVQLNAQLASATDDWRVIDETITTTQAVPSRTSLARDDRYENPN